MHSANIYNLNNSSFPNLITMKPAAYYIKNGTEFICIQNAT